MMSIQEQIDALPDHSGGTIHIERGVTVTEPIRIINKSFVTIRGAGAGQSIVGDFETPGPLFYVAGSPWFRMFDLGLQQIRNVECGILGCRTGKFNGPQSSNMILSGLNVQGEFLHSAIATAGCDGVLIADCRLNPRHAGTFGWWTGSNVPTYHRIGSRAPSALGYGLGAFGGTAVGQRILRGYVTSNALDVTSIRLDDGVVQARIETFVSNSPTWTKDGEPIGRACISLGRTDNVVIDNTDTESADCDFGVLVDGVCKALSIRGGRYQGRRAFYVDSDGGLYNSVIDRTAKFETLGLSNRCPIVIEPGAQIQNTILDIGGYVG